jgi:malonyl-CoA O-methyltransferase
MTITSSKKILKRSFDRSALNYDQYGKFNQTVGQILLTKLNNIKDAGDILDIGPGTGYVTRGLTARLSPSSVYGLDLAHNMLKQARSHSEDIPIETFFIQGDAEKLPFKNESFNMAFSNLTYQWINNLKEAFREVKRVLKKKGCFIFSLFGQGTLAELKSVMELYPPQKLPSVDIIKKNISSAGFMGVNIEEKTKILYFSSGYKVAAYLHNIGSRNIFLNSSRGLGNGIILKKIINSYEKKFKKGNKIPATFKIIFVKAEKK